MPQAIVPLLGTIGITGTAAVVVANAIVIAGSLALSSSQKRKAERQARAAFDASQVDRMSNLMTQVGVRELVLGKVRKGGTVFFRSSTGYYNERFYMCMALAAHEIDGVTQVYFNDIPVELQPGTGFVTTAPWGRITRTGTVTQVTSQVFVLPHLPIEQGTDYWVQEEWSTGGPDGDLNRRPVRANITGQTITLETWDPTHTYRAGYQYDDFKSYARVIVHRGEPGQVADQLLMEQFPGVWTAAHVGIGIAYLVCEFLYDETAYPSGLPNVTAEVRGAKMYDARSNDTGWTDNPAVMQRHVLTHPQFGKRASITASESARIVAASNACDTGISYDGTDFVGMFRAGIVVPFGSTAKDVLDDLAQAMGGQWAFAAGEFHVRAGVYQAPVMALTEADLAVVERSNDGAESQSEITVSAHLARNDKINTVLPRIWDQAANYTLTAINPLRAAALIAKDGGEIVQEITMPAVFYAGQAFHVAGITLRDARDPLTFSGPLKLTAYQLELFDGVTLALPHYGWAAKEFRVISRSFLPDGRIQVVLKETTAAIYQYGAGFLPQGYAPNTSLPQPWNIQPPEITSISSGESELVVQTDGTIVNGVRVTWSPILNASITQGGYVDVEWSRPGEQVSGTVVVAGSETSALILGMPDGAAILIRARTRSALARSNWTVMIPHIVVGKTEPPPDIEDLSISGGVLSWRLPRRVPDLDGFVFRFHYGNNLDWNSATPLHNGVLTESPYDLVTRPGGVVTIMGKAIDTTGNVSKNTANIVMNLGDPPIENIVEQWDFEAMGWPYAAGEQSGWTLVGGDPSANATDSLYGTDDQSFYGADNVSFYDAGAYGQMVYVTSEISVSSALAGSKMTVEIQAQGDDLRVDYRLAGPGSKYGPEDSSFYGGDADPFYGAPGGWQPWPGQIIAANEVYQFRVTIGASVERGILQGLVVTIDAPDLEEEIEDFPIAAGGSVILHSLPFTSIKTVIAQLQTNGSGAVRIEIDKTNPLAPVIRAFNSAGTSVSGATADIRIKGY